MKNMAYMNAKQKTILFKKPFFKNFNPFKSHKKNNPFETFKQKKKRRRIQFNKKKTLNKNFLFQIMFHNNCVQIL